MAETYLLLAAVAVGALGACLMVRDVRACWSTFGLRLGVMLVAADAVIVAVGAGLGAMSTW